MENSNALHMSRLREKIKPSQALQDVLWPFAHPSHFHNLPHVSRLRVHITADIHNGLGSKIEKLLDEELVAAFSWRIDEDGGLVWWKVAYDGKDFSGVACSERNFVGGDVVELGVVGCKADRVLGELDASHLVEGG